MDPFSMGALLNTGGGGFSGSSEATSGGTQGQQNPFHGGNIAFGGSAGSNPQNMTVLVLAVLAGAAAVYLLKK